jgi:hypothetical protein
MKMPFWLRGSNFNNSTPSFPGARRRTVRDQSTEWYQHSMKEKENAMTVLIALLP